MLIVVGGEKGGSGKTNAAINLAVCYALRRADVVLVDSDPQRTAARWCEGRAALDLPPVRFQQLLCQDSGKGYFAQLTDLRSRYGIVIVDVGGADTDAFRVAVARADQLVSPIIPSECDTDTAALVASVVQQVRSMGNTRLLARWLLNQCSTHPGDDEAVEALAELAEAAPDVPALAARLSHRKAFRRAYRMRMGAVELANEQNRELRKLGASAASEVWNLYTEVSGDAIESANAAE